MNRQEHLLTIAAEEAAEVQQRISKALRFGLEQIQQDADDAPEQNPKRLTNAERIEEEFTDLVTMLDMAGVIQINHEGCISINAVRQGEKQRRVERYLERSNRCGTLDPR